MILTDSMRFGGRAISREELLATQASWQARCRGGQLRMVVGGGLGDCLAHTPFLRHFRKSGEYRRISCVCPTRAAAIFEANPHLDELICCTDPELVRWADPNQTSDVFAPYFQFGFADGGGSCVAHGWLAHPARRDQTLVREIAANHGINLADDRPEIFTRPEDEAVAERLLNASISLPRVLIDTRQGDSFKSLAPEKWLAVCSALRGFSTVIEQGITPLLPVECRLSPLPPLRVSAALYRRVDCVVGVDSFPIHLATAVGTPAVAIFGPSDPKKYGHGNNPNLRPSDCEPCFQPAERPCVRARCLEVVSADEIVGAILSAIRARG